MPPLVCPSTSGSARSCSSTVSTAKGNVQVASSTGWGVLNGGKKKKCSRTSFPKKARGHSMCSTMVGGGWRLAVGGWRSLVAVLKGGSLTKKNKKKSRPLRTPLSTGWGGTLQCQRLKQLVLYVRVHNAAARGLATDRRHGQERLLQHSEPLVSAGSLPCFRHEGCLGESSGLERNWGPMRHCSLILGFGSIQVQWDVIWLTLGTQWGQMKLESDEVGV